MCFFRFRSAYTVTLRLAIATLCSVAVASDLDDLLARKAALQTEIFRLAEQETKVRSAQTRLHQLQQVVAQARSDLSDVRTELRGARAAGAETNKTADSLRQPQTEIMAKARAAATATRSRVAAGIPYQLNERLAILDHCLVLLTSEPAAGTAAFLAFLRDELSLSAETAFSATPVEFSGRTLPSYQIRLGLAELYAVSEDGKRISMSADGAWIEAPEATRERLKAAVQMLRKRARRALVALPTGGAK